MRRHLLGLSSALALAVGTVWAQDADELFGKLDANKDGYVTPDEVQDSQKSLYQRLVRTSDKNGDGKLSKEEFQAGLRPDEGPKTPLGGQPSNERRPGRFPSLQERFQQMDANNDGKLTKEELSPRQPESFAQMDSNSDGYVSLEEFTQWTRARAVPPPGFVGDVPDPRRLEEMFAQRDINKDGKLTEDEVLEDRRGFFKQFVQRLNPGGNSLTKEHFAREGMMFLLQATGNQPPFIGQRVPGRPREGNMFDRDQLEALFDRTDSNSDGKLTKDEIPEERLGMRGILERAGGESLSKDQFVRGMMAMAQAVGQPPRPEGAPSRPENAPPRRPGGPPGGPPGGGLFAALDVDRNGEISTAEIVGAGTALLKLDRNSDGKLTPDEVFGPGGPPGTPPGRPSEGRPGQPGVGGPGAEEFRQRMRAADTNGDGKISKEEAPPMLKERFDRVDANGDGYIDQEEARRMFERGGNPQGKRPPGDKN